MLNIVNQTIEFFLKNLRKPELNEIQITAEQNYLLQKQWCIFVTIFLNWEIRWSAWNIKEIKANLALELIENTIEAISKDSRFKTLTNDEYKNIGIRVDLISSRNLLQKTEKEKSLVEKIDPVKFWIITIKKNYEKLAVILPNIDSNIKTGTDFIDIINNKLWEIFKEENFIIYQIETEIQKSF